MQMIDFYFFLLSLVINLFMYQRESSCSNYLEHTSYSTIQIKEHDNRRQIQLEQQKVRERMIRMTYAIKTIDSRDDQELGVRTRRVVMGIKQIEREKQQLKRKTRQNRSIYTERSIRPLRCTSTLQVSNPSQSQISHQIGIISQNPQQQSIPANLSSSNHSSLPKPTIPHKQFISKPLKVPSKPKVVKQQQNTNQQILLKDLEGKLKEKDQKKTISQDKLNNFNENGVQNQQTEKKFRRSKSSVENMSLKYEINAFRRKITMKSLKQQDEYLNEPISARIHQNSCQQSQNHNIFSRNHFPSVLATSKTQHRISVSSLLTKYAPSIIESSESSKIPLKQKLSILLTKNMNLNLNTLRQRTTKDKFSSVINSKGTGVTQNPAQCHNRDKNDQTVEQDKFLRYSQVQQAMKNSKPKTFR